MALLIQWLLALVKITSLAFLALSIIGGVMMVSGEIDLGRDTWLSGTVAYLFAEHAIRQWEGR